MLVIDKKDEDRKPVPNFGMDILNSDIIKAIDDARDGRINGTKCWRFIF